MEEWITYKQLAERLHCSPNAARMFAVRRGWPRRAPNRIGDAAHVLVPDGAAVREHATHVAAPSVARANGAETDVGHVAPAIREAVAPLHALLCDALAAERIARDEAARLRGELDRRKEWGLLRRVGWAIRKR